jgi:hypothetical protein
MALQVLRWSCMKTHVIHWTSAVSGRVGTGTKLFQQAEAEKLATELNLEYPAINHEAVLFVPRPVEPEAVPA